MFIEQLEKKDFVRLAHQLGMELDCYSVRFDSEQPSAYAIFSTGSNNIVRADFTDYTCIIFGQPALTEQLSKYFYDLMNEKFDEEYLLTYCKQNNINDNDYSL